jgi:intracellular septation protein A
MTRRDMRMTNDARHLAAPTQSPEEHAARQIGDSAAVLSPPEPSLLGITLYPTRGKRPVWPLVIGINSFAIACLSMLLTLFTATLDLHTDVTWVTMILHTLLDTVLLGGAIALIQRKDLGRRLHVIWAVLCLCLLFALLVYVIGICLDSTFTRWEMTNRDDISKHSWTEIILGFAMFFLFMAGYPIFVLIWMTRRRASKDLRHW